MAANTSLQGGAALTLEQRIARLEAALRGGPPVLNAQGAPTHQSTDLGSALNAWGDLYASGVIIGNARVDIAALSGSAPVYAFHESDATFEWPPDTLTRCMAMVFSGVGKASTMSGIVPGPGGGATTVTIGGVTISSGKGPSRISTVVSDSLGWGTVNEGARIGLQRSGAKLFTGLSQGASIGISIGAGDPASFAGDIAGDDGFALLFGIA